MRIYRGANAGIIEQCCGSFYSEHYDLALTYSSMEEDPCIYAYNIELNLIDIKDTENGQVDDGILSITNEELLEYDGYTDKNGYQICLFGRLSNECLVDSLTCNKKGIFIKPSIEEMRKDATSSFRRYDR